MLIYVSIASILIATVLFYYNWTTNRNSLYLSIALMILAVHGISHSLLLYGKPLLAIVVLFNNFSPLYFLLGPLIFFYTRGTLLDNWKIKFKDTWHFIPFLVVIILVAPYWFTPTEYKTQIINQILLDKSNAIKLNPNKYFPSITSLVARAALILIYMFASLFMLITHKYSKKENIPDDQYNITFRWLFILIISFILLSLSYILFSLQYFFPILRFSLELHNSEYLFGYAAVLSFLFILIALIFFPQILYGIPIEKKVNKELSIQSELIAINQSEIANEISQSGTQEVPFTELANQIKLHLDLNKPYLDPNFTMDDLARALDVPRHHLYYCMNKVLKQKFPDLRKDLRIKHAKKLIEMGEHNVLSIDGIGFQSGFASRSSFYNTFKSVVGMTPTEYVEKINKLT